MPLEHANFPSAPGDPSPLVPDYLYDLKKAGRERECDAALEGLASPQQSVYWRNALVANIT